MQTLRFHPSARVALLRPLVAGFGRGLPRFVFAAGGSRPLLPRPCRVLVLLNPRGGKGKALQLFQSRVQPLLAEAEVSFTLMLTGEYRVLPLPPPHTYSGPPCCRAQPLQGTGSRASPQSGRTMRGSWCVQRSWAAGMRWWSCLGTG
jgi:hypothetical protein